LTPEVYSTNVGMYGSVTKKSQPCIDYTIRMILDDIVDASTSGT